MNLSPAHLSRGSAFTSGTRDAIRRAVAAPDVTARSSYSCYLRSVDQHSRSVAGQATGKVEVLNAQPQPPEQQLPCCILDSMSAAVSSLWSIKIW